MTIDSSLVLPGVEPLDTLEGLVPVIAPDGVEAVVQRHQAATAPLLVQGSHSLPPGVGWIDSGWTWVGST